MTAADRSDQSDGSEGSVETVGSVGSPLRLRVAQPLCTWTHDLNTGATHWSDAGDLLGLGSGDLPLDQLFDRVPAGDRERVRRMVLAANSIETTLTHGLLGRDGRLLSIEQHVALDPSRSLLTGTIYDVTERQGMESALALLAKMPSGEDADFFFRACTRHLALLYDVRFAFIATVGPGGASAQTRAIWTGAGFGEDFEYELEGTPCQDVMSLDKELIPEGAASLYPEDTLLAEMGVESYFGAPLFDADGQVFGIVSVMDTRPLTVSSWTAPVLAVFASRVAAELVRRREALAASERESQLERQLEGSRRLSALGRLAGGVAHDFNNLLTVIGGNAELLADAANLDSEQREMLLEVAESSRQASLLTQRLASFSRGELVEPERVDVGLLIANKAAVLRRLVEPQASLLLNPPETALHCLLDAGQLEQILLNLVVNARDAMPRGGLVTLAVRRVLESDKPYAALSVSDEGCGMTPEVQAQMFEPFFTTKGEQGTGLGLATVYGIVRAASGQVTVQSTPGQGSTFRVLLPLCEPEA